MFTWYRPGWKKVSVVIRLFMMHVTKCRACQCLPLATTSHVNRNLAVVHVFRLVDLHFTKGKIKELDVDS
jgi:hypothetical protein